MSAALDPTPAMPNPHIPASEKSRTGLILLFVLIIGAPAIVLGVFSDPFTQPADERNILANPLVSDGLTQNAFRLVGSAPIGGALQDFLQQFQPIAKLSIGLQYALYQDQAWSFRLINLALHLFSALLLYQILKATMPGTPSSSIGADTLNMDSAFRGKGRVPAALGVGCFYFHPAVVGSVAVPGNHASVLSLFFCILAWYLTVHRGAAGEIWTRVAAAGPYAFLAALLAYLFALLASPVSIGFSVVLALTEFCLVYGSRAERCGRGLGFLLMALCWLLMGLVVRKNALSVDWLLEFQSLGQSILICMLPWMRPDILLNALQVDWGWMLIAGGLLLLAILFGNWLPMAPRRMSILILGMVVMLLFALLGTPGVEFSEVPLYFSLPLGAALIAFICDGIYYRIRFLGMNTGKAVAKIAAFGLILICFTFAAGSLKRTIDLHKATTAGLPDDK